MHTVKGVIATQAFSINKSSLDPWCLLRIILVRGIRGGKMQICNVILVLSLPNLEKKIYINLSCTNKCDMSMPMKWSTEFDKSEKSESTENFYSTYS